jgi:hypothetical protein
MRAQRPLLRCLCLGALLALCLAPLSFAQAAADKPKTGGTAEMSAPMNDQMAQEMMKLAAPGEHHKRLDSMVGKWKTHIKMFMAPNQPPSESDGTMEASWILGGRFLVSKYHGTFMGMPFEGQGMDGYDNVTKKYVSTWIDNMGTGILNMNGSCDTDCKVLTSSGEMVDPTSGQKGTFKGVITFVDPNTFKYEAYFVDATGNSMKVMEQTGTRSH